jgi:hypothetical protein
MRSIEDDSHGKTTNGTSNGNCHDPREDQETNSLPVDSLVGAVAETNTDRGAGNAHRGGHRKGILREDEDGKRGTHFHGTTYC